MTTTEEGTIPRRFFSSIASLLQPGRRNERSGSGASDVSASPNEKTYHNDTLADSQRTGRSPSSIQDEVDSRADNADRRRNARTVPAWVHSLEEGESQDIIDPDAALLPRAPVASRGPHHNHMPIPKPRPDGSATHDGAYEGGVMARTPIEQVSRWQAFARASAFPAADGNIVSEQWMQENLPDFDRPWTPVLPSEQGRIRGFWLFSAEGRHEKGERWNRMLMRNPFVPLVVRLTVMLYCAAALALGAWIYNESAGLNSSPALKVGTSTASGSNQNYICEQQTSTYMAFTVNSIAVLYLFYITWDEYTSKPLGLRRTRAKMRLLFLDLLFIVFSAADLSLAFNTLTDQQWSCFSGSVDNDNNAQAARSTCVYSSSLCNRQKALVSMLLIAEVAWVITFAISVMRVVERISS